jgi:hypothetical protein
VGRAAREAADRDVAGLGRVPRGYFVVSGQANLIGQTAPADASFLYVSTGGGTETITFWVF